MKDKLSISAVLPCYNDLNSLKSHVESIKKWIKIVEKCFIVDSSNDASLEFLKESLASENNVEFHSVPPGLYSAWNYGISLVKSKYCYFSTIGDYTFPAGLIHLLENALLYDLDLIVSPPVMVDKNAIPVDTRWPIHDFAASLNQDCALPNRTETVHCLTAFLPFTILGSSASNLYRTDFLKANPFPTEYGHGGDAAFGAKISPFVRMGITRKMCSRFVTHGQGRDITAREQLEVAKKFLALLESMSMPAEAESTAAISRALLKNKIELFEWLAGLEPLAGVLKEQQSYIDMLEGQNAMLRSEREALSRMAVGIPLPFVKAGHLLSLKRFVKWKIGSLRKRN